MFTYFKEVRAEMKHVSWPTRRQTVVYTLVVIAVSLITSVYLGLLDYLFSYVIKHIIG
jgi:preprotein translocase subunit SecE